MPRRHAPRNRETASACRGIRPEPLNVARIYGLGTLSPRKSPEEPMCLDIIPGRGFSRSKPSALTVHSCHILRTEPRNPRSNHRRRTGAYRIRQISMPSALPPPNSPPTVTTSTGRSVRGGLRGARAPRRARCPARQALRRRPRRTRPRFPPGGAARRTPGRRRRTPRPGA